MDDFRTGYRSTTVFDVDSDTITSSTHVEPRGGVLLSLTGDGKTLLKAGAGIFYDRVPLMLPRFAELPGRTVALIGPEGRFRVRRHSSIELPALSKTREAQHGMSNLSGGLQNGLPSAPDMRTASRQEISSYPRPASRNPA